MATGNGSVEKLPSGRFRARISLEGKLQPLGTFNTEEEARGVADAATLQVVNASQLGKALPGEETLASYGERWMRAREIAGKHRGIQKQWSVWNMHIKTSPLGARSLCTITKRDVQAWLEVMEAKPVVRRFLRGGVWVDKNFGGKLSWKTVQHAFLLMRGCLQAATQKDIITANPARDVKFEPDKSTTEDAWTFLTTDEIERIRTCEAIPERNRNIFIVAVYTGLRKGELWGLHWRDVDMDGPRPKVTARYSHKGPTKPGKKREVPLMAPALAALRAHRQAAPKDTGGDLVFRGEHGERYHPNYDGGWTSRSHKNRKTPRVGYREAAGVRSNVRFHDMRHTCASHLVMGTWGRQWSLQEVCKLLGHANVKTTEIYAHLSPDHLHNAAMQTAVAVSTTAPTSSEPTETTHGTHRGAGAVGSHAATRGYGSRGSNVEAWAGLLRTMAKGEAVPVGLIESLLDDLIGDDVAKVAARLRHKGYDLSELVDLATEVVLTSRI